MKNDHLKQEPLKNVNLGMNEKLGVILMVKLHLYYEHMRIVRHMLITICRTTMLNLSHITK